MVKKGLLVKVVDEKSGHGFTYGQVVEIYQYIPKRDPRVPDQMFCGPPGYAENGVLPAKYYVDPRFWYITFKEFVVVQGNNEDLLGVLRSD